MGIHIQPIAGVVVNEDCGYVSLPGFDLVSSEVLLEYLDKVHQRTIHNEFIDVDWDSVDKSNSTYLVIRRDLEDDAIDFAHQLEVESVFCASVLSIAYWIHSDLRFTVHLNHEAYTFKGNTSLILSTKTQRESVHNRSATRGFTVFTYDDPIPITQELAYRIATAPLLAPLFEYCSYSVKDRTPLMQSILLACKQLYFGYSAHYPEAQLIGAVSCIDALLALPDDEESELARSNGLERKSYRLKPTRSIKMILGLARLSRLVTFDDYSEMKEKARFSVFRVRNDVVHNGGSCSEIDVVESFRLAVRVLLSIAHSTHFYQTRKALVASLIKHDVDTLITVGRLKVAVFDSYPWIDLGMPDFMSFTIPRLYRERDGEEYIHSAESLAKSCLFISKQKNVSIRTALDAILKSDLTGSISVSDEEVLSFCEILMTRHTDNVIVKPRCEHSPLGWHTAIDTDHSPNR